MTTPCYPIIYVRGYAGTQTEIEDTVATPYMGFNVGSTKTRQLWDAKVVKHIFESPLLRLMKDHGYSDVYEDGQLTNDRPVNAKSVWIYRYYDLASEAFADGKRPEIEDYAAGLYSYIEHVRDAICGEEDPADPETAQKRQDFKVYLVAHSMGGLVARCYLQNIFPTRHPDRDPPVDKAFTYATPHGGIDFRLIGNVPAFLTANNVDNFNEGRMREYLKITDAPVHSLNGRFDHSRFFSLVGTNYRDYTVAMGLSSAAVGPMSDGLVQIKNACTLNSPRAFVHRAHGGHYGIVNSEEGYQNLRRFLFGDVRIDITLEIEDITLPAAVAKQKAKGHQVRASYHAEAVIRVRGAVWDLHRRLTDESSAYLIPYERIENQRPVYLYTGYLSSAARVKGRGPLGFSMDLGVLVPQYEVEKRLRFNDHYEGGYLYREKLNFDLSLKPEGFSLKYGLDRSTPNRATRRVDAVETAQGSREWEFRIPVVSNSKPGIKAELVIRSKPWE